LRRAAREALEARDGDGRIRRALLTDAGAHPEAALELLEQVTAEGTLPGDGAGWGRLLLLAALDLLEHPPRDAHRKRALALVAVESPLDAFLRAHPIPEDERASVAARLAKWQASDRYRFPVLDLLQANGHEDISLQVEAARARAAARVSGRVGGDSEDPYAGATLLTRATFLRLEGERQRVGIELKTTIPRAIQKAREHGDLRENAEYEAAKAKQAVYAKRFSELEGLLSRVRLIDDLKRESGVASPGTEIQLREAEGNRTWRYWLLGEGDQGLSPEVVSYRAPLGKALLGRHVGEVLELPVEGGSVRCRVDSIEERVPSVGE
jgi:transcription elongation factor GreA